MQVFKSYIRNVEKPSIKAHGICHGIEERSTIIRQTACLVRRMATGANCHAQSDISSDAAVHSDSQICLGITMARRVRLMLWVSLAERQR